jgi:hypothetical protein
VSDPIGIPIGELNCIELVLGDRGQGKSTYCIDKAMSLAYATGGYVIGHSLGARFPEKLPDGTPTPIDYYPSIQKLDEGLKTKSDRIAVLVGGDGDALLRYARSLSVSIRKRAYYRENGWIWALLKPWTPLSKMNGIVARPVIVIIDEGVALSMNLGKTGAKSVESKEFRESIYGARHEHIAYLFQIQDPNAIGAALQTQATRYVVFHIGHQWALNAVGSMGATREDIVEIQELTVGEYVEFGPDVPRAKAPSQLAKEARAEVKENKDLANAGKTVQPPEIVQEKK